MQNNSRKFIKNICKRSKVSIKAVRNSNKKQVKLSDENKNLCVTNKNPWNNTSRF